MLRLNPCFRVGNGEVKFVSANPSYGIGFKEAMQKALDSRGAIEELVRGFYGKIRGDALLCPIFERGMERHEAGQGGKKSDWSHHEVRVCDFWETVLLGAPKFKSRSLLQHLEVDEICPLCPFHFERWCALFEASVDENFGGERADIAKKRARAMSIAMQRQLAAQRGGCPFAAVLDS